MYFFVHMKLLHLYLVKEIKRGSLIGLFRSYIRLYGFVRNSVHSCGVCCNYSVIIIGIGGSIKTWSKNNNSPQLSVPASVKTKRTETSGGSGESAANTWYYVTFEVQSGDRMELPVRGHEFGQLAEGDLGLLTFQGTRYINFERKIEPQV